MVGHGHQQAQGRLALQMALHHAPLKHLRNGIGGDETKAPQHRVLARQKLRRAVPPIHDEIGAFVHMRMSGPERLHIVIAQPRAQILAAHERRIAHDELRLRPLRTARLVVAIDLHQRAIRPRPRQRLAALIPGQGLVGLQHRIHHADVPERLQDGFGRRIGPAAEMPLQKADP